MDDAEPGVTLTSDGVHSISLATSLAADPRPGFIVDLARVRKSSLRLGFWNEALSSQPSLYSAIRGSGNIDPAFRTWVLAGDQPDFDFSGTTWTAYTVHQRYRVVSSNVCRHNSKSSGKSKSSTDTSVSIRDSGQKNTTRTTNNITDGKSTIQITGGDPKFPSSLADTRLDFSDKQLTLRCTDWTAEEPVGVLTPHEIFARNTDWASTPLGPMSSWDPIFRELANLVMRNPHPATLVWGEDMTMLYNEPYRIEVAGKKHPAMMGSGFFVDFPELWSGKLNSFSRMLCPETCTIIWGYTMCLYLLVADVRPPLNC
jgi:hypothetical protein